MIENKDLAAMRALMKGAGGGGGGGTSIDVTAQVGQTIVVKEVDANGKPTAWESADYQEKICGEGEKFIVNNATVEFAFNEELGAWVGFSPCSSVFEADTIYRVTFNGEVYENRLVEIEDSIGGIGNFGVFGLEDTGEPYIMQVDDGMLAVMCFTEIETATITIAYDGIIPIEKKFLPDDTMYELHGAECRVIDLEHLWTSIFNEFLPTNSGGNEGAERDIDATEDQFRLLFDIFERRPLVTHRDIESAIGLSYTAMNDDHMYINFKFTNVYVHNTGVLIKSLNYDIKQYSDTGRITMAISTKEYTLKPN